MDYLINHYENLYKKYDKSPLSLQHANSEQQLRRYKIISSKIKSHYSILDFGCGLSDFCNFLFKEKKHKGKYTGVDIVPTFIRENKKLFLKNEKVNFINSNLLEVDRNKKFDYCIACGTFNNFVPNLDQKEYLKNSLLKLFDLSKEGISFNLLTTYVTYKDPNLFYFDPKEILDYCKKNLGPFIELKHDYILNKGGYPYEYTIHIRKKPYL